jgi:mevalonate kinase
VIKLLGEHAVVYGKLAIAAAIDMNAVAISSKCDQGLFQITLEDFYNRTLSVNEKELELIYEKYKTKQNINEYVRDSTIEPIFLPYVTIAARLACAYNIKIIGKNISIKSEIPVQKGYASSAACSTAFTVAILSATGAKLSDDQIIDIARDGDRVVHKNENAGAIDVSTTYYGGIVSYSKQDGAKMEQRGANLDVVMIDTGPKKSTAETVGHVANLYKIDKQNTEVMLENINRCSNEGLQCLKENEIQKFGKLMYEDHEMLRLLGVSSEGLDRAVELGKRAGAHGVKLSGGGGGGIAIAIGRDPQAIINSMNEAGFKAYKTRITDKGAKDYM